MILQIHDKVDCVALDWAATYSNKATLAVNPWMKFLQPIGPNSPWANKPANGIGPTFSWMVLAS